MVHEAYREDYVVIKLKTDESMRRAVSDPAIPTFLFLLYYVIWVF
jgi:hypothetical protein